MVWEVFIGDVSIGYINSDYIYLIVNLAILTYLILVLRLAARSKKELYLPSISDTRREIKKIRNKGLTPKVPLWLFYLKNKKYRYNIKCKGVLMRNNTMYHFSALKGNRAIVLSTFIVTEIDLNQSKGYMCGVLPRVDLVIGAGETRNNTIIVAGEDIKISELQMDVPYALVIKGKEREVMQLRGGKDIGYLYHDNLNLLAVTSNILNKRDPYYKQGGDSVVLKGRGCSTPEDVLYLDNLLDSSRDLDEVIKAHSACRAFKNYFIHRVKDTA